MKHPEMSSKLYADEQMHGHHQLWAPRSTTPEDVLTDVLDIYEPPQGRLGAVRRWFRLQAASTKAVTLTPKHNSSKGQRVPEYQIEVSGGAQGEVNVSTKTMHIPGQAAGWAALELYRHTAWGETLPRLCVVDPVSDREKQVEEYDWRAVSEADTVPGFMSALADRAKAVQRSNILFTKNPCDSGGTLVAVRNGLDGNGRASLPDLLHTVKGAYDDLYPDQLELTSAAVANVVGAGRLDEFSDAWGEAAGAGTPVEAAQMLLASDVFLQEPR